MTDELVQEARLKEVSFLRDSRFLGQYYVLSGSWISGEQSPVDVTPITKVRVVAVLRGKTEYALYKLLGVCRSLEEELHRGGEELELNLSILVMEVLHKGAEQFVHIVDTITVLP